MVCVGIGLSGRGRQLEYLASDLIRMRSFDRDGRAGVMPKGHVFHDNEALQVLLQLGRPLRLAVDQNVIFTHEDSRVGLDMTLNIKKKCTYALPRPQACHVVTAHRVDELHAVFAAHPDSPAGRNIHPSG